jgi:hypothetical protein
MWRALLLATGVTLIMLGAQCALLDHFTLRPPAPTGAPSQQLAPQGEVITPPAWASAMLLLGGSVVVLGSWKVNSRRDLLQDTAQGAKDDHDDLDHAAEKLAALVESEMVSNEEPDQDLDGFFDEEDFFDDDGDDPPEFD